MAALAPFADESRNWLLKYGYIHENVEVASANIENIIQLPRPDYKHKGEIEYAEYFNEQEDIIERLIDLGVCFAICMTFNKLFNYRDNYIIALHDDWSDLRLINFASPADGKYPDYLVQRNLTPLELSKFKKVQHLFVKITHPGSGHVFELKDNSFREFYKQRIRHY